MREKYFGTSVVFSKMSIANRRTCFGKNVNRQTEKFPLTKRDTVLIC